MENRADLDFALQLGRSTQFSIKDVPGRDSISWIRARFKQESKNQICDWPSFRKLGADLQDVLIDITSLAWFINESPRHKRRLNGYAFHDILILIGYDLNQVNPLAIPRPTFPLENLLHLGLTAFMTQFLLGLGHQRPEFHLLYKLITSASWRASDDGDDECQTVLLWTLLVARTSVFRQRDDTWLVSRLAEIARAQSLYTWEDVRRKLSWLPWIDAIQSKIGLQLWHRWGRNRNSLNSTAHIP